MRIVQVKKFGTPEALMFGEAPDPVADPGQVLVDVSVAPDRAIGARTAIGMTLLVI